ncbi:MAG: co-chaperone GroES [Sulfurospirillaceae bacterium]|jgi:chaperonin GroES|nr:co-chaperone GroES [Sulfurospirillaceae bacterium]MCK9546092.1 co-chaperone GroES [Sulfurospirillaceae bacterium]MDY0238039.1 co-chaperone GroES [Campylobacterales bacterium]NLM98419.1 co-chaperone GroES [Campylobacteraceae bacterium]
MNFQPLGQRILVERLEEPTTTASGIIIPENAKEKPLSGTVKAISKEVADEGLVAVDDRVVFAKYSGNELTLDGKEYLVLNLDDVLGVMK